MPVLVLNARQCQLAFEAFMCLKTARLERENLRDAAALQELADYVTAASTNPAPDPQGLPAPGTPEDVRRRTTGVDTFDRRRPE